MKKILALVIVAVMALSASGCNSVKDAISDAINDEISNVTNNIKDEISNAVGGSIGEAFNNAAEDIAGELGDVATQSMGLYTPEYWCEFFETNRCPFSIDTIGISLDYYFRDGGYLDYWVYTEENTAGWYVNDGYVISADNALGIKIDESDSFSSCCAYNTSVFKGETLSKEEQKELKTGCFYTLNSYTPVRTNWGIVFYTDDKLPKDSADFDTKPYGKEDTLKDQQYFNIYVARNSNDKFDSENIKLWAFEHKDKSEYPAVMDEKFLENGVDLGTLSYDSDSNLYKLNTYIPNEGADGFKAGQVDLVMTFGNDLIVTVGVMTVNTLSGEN